MSDDDGWRYDTVPVISIPGEGVRTMRIVGQPRPPTGDPLLDACIDLGTPEAAIVDDPNPFPHLHLFRRTKEGKTS